MTSPTTAPPRYHDRLGRPYLLDRHAVIGPKGKAIEFGQTEEIRPVRRVYTLADEQIFEVVLEAVVANAGARKAVLESYRSARADRSLTPDVALDLLATAVETMRAVSGPRAREIVEARTKAALAPGKDALCPAMKAGAQAAAKAARATAVRRGHRHRT